MNHQEEQQFYKLLRLSLGLTQEFLVEVDADGWRRLYQTAIRQSLVGVCYQGVCLLPEGSKPPAEIAMQWASEAESIKGTSVATYRLRRGCLCSKNKKSHRKNDYYSLIICKTMGKVGCIWKQMCIFAPRNQLNSYRYGIQGIGYCK